MKPVFRPTTPEDYPRLREFLIRIFDARPDDLFLRQDQMHWKYWEPRPDWPGPRSFVVERDGKIAAHGGVWPMPVRLGQAEEWIPSFNLIDWVSDPAYPGLGTAMVRKMAAAGEPVWVFGGTPAARAMREAGGFQTVHPVGIHALPLRPWAMERNRPSLSWRGAARLGRNIRWSLGARAARSGWSVSELTPSSAQAAAAAEAARGMGPGFQSSLSIALYYSKCPVARMKWWELRRDGARAGYFCLALMPGQARLVDGRAGDGSAASWQALASLAATQAKAEGAHEFVAWGARPETSQGLRAAGVRERSADDLLVYDRLQRLPAGQTYDFHFLHSDRAFLHPGTPAYLW